MSPSTRTIPIVAVIAVAAFSGALASAVVERAAVAAAVPSVQNPQLTNLSVQNPQLTNLLKYITVDSSGNVTIKGAQISIQGTTVQISAQASALLQGGATTVIKGGVVTIN